MSFSFFFFDFLFLGFSKHMHGDGEVRTQTTRGEEFQILNVLKYRLNIPTLKKLVDACVKAITPLDNKVN